MGLRSRAIRLAPSNLLRWAKAAVDRETLIVNWVNRGPVRENWGDAVAPVLMSELTGRPVVNDRDILRIPGRDRITSIGSMLGTVTGPDIVVWGSGFVETKASLRTKPKRICAVRGPLSRAKLLHEGVACPEVFGDPALLFPDLYSPTIQPVHTLGVIPHFKEADLPIIQSLRAQGAHVIDIRAGLQAVANEVRACQTIISGSLHGLVLADAYAIPSYWVEFSDRPYGDGFKFKDYLGSVGRDMRPLSGPLRKIEEYKDRMEPYALQWDREAFAAACPVPILPVGARRGDGRPEG